jgi:hypothetical protein
MIYQRYFGSDTQFTWSYQFPLCETCGRRFAANDRYFNAKLSSVEEGIIQEVAIGCSHPHYAYLFAQLNDLSNMYVKEKARNFANGALTAPPD